MLRVDAGREAAYCDGVTRRSFVQLGVAGMAAVGLPEVLRAKAASAESTGARASKKTSAILVWLDGGPSHLDLYDMKPEAPSEVRGIWRPIPTNVPGIKISEMFPRQAKVADKFSIVRSLHHGTGDHFAAAHRMLTTKDMGVSGANTTGRFPSLGPIVARELGARRAGMLPYVATPNAASVGLVPGYFGGNFLGPQYDPFQTGGDPNAEGFKVQDLDPAAGLTLDRLERRATLVGDLDRINRAVDAGRTFAAMDRFEEEALGLVTGEHARKAFDLSSEEAGLRDRYGRHTWGQSCLLARRLVEAGATFVTAHFGGWDHHWDLESGMKSYLPMLDSAVATLFEDLADRGMLETTLVIVCGEFSRTPRMNDGGNGGPPGSKGTPGRDHWGDAMFCLLGGGGVKGGMIVGETDAKGQAPKSRPLRPDNVHATIYRCLGVDPTLHLLDPTGRPTPVLEDPRGIEELV